MKLEKAIKILSESAYAGVTTFNLDLKDAQKLGIEVMKARLAIKRQYPHVSWLLLPGETPEED